MNEDLSRKRLGRGLAALIGDLDKPAAPSPSGNLVADRTAPIEFVSPNPRNPRRSFAEDDLEDLTQSIREHGIVQPVVVRTMPDGRYEIIAGERRWRAAQRAGLTSVPIVIRDVTDRVALELAIIENVQRADLNPVEEALGYQKLIDEHQYTQADLGQVIGKSRSHVANTLRLLKLPDHVRSMVTDGSLSAGHARTLVTALDPAGLARRIVDEGLSVRQAESLAQQPVKQAHGTAERHAPEKDADTIALEKTLSDALGLKVSITHGQRGGDIRIRYSSLEQLDTICHRLQRN
ncbi:ParB/RepB/Spo0J family partition protein [Mesorhizobium sp. YIM 152430]|uniref:ParB/RepB/Spo0J family partition protein n=1 Tax=Mesorhizobium sp. YIM 152430 TaxID=3031761 RepID=UPI0023DCDF5B|nr:ParB/RepB/Spo0J family partition protein [Mesorhizobium sp. YIM 152430]MDF1600730.1 ParB/RepB/Spo0J family partition protein [Mesorhizobium sp. YIM 152430]